MATFQTLPGFREFYPEDLSRRNHIFRVWRQTAHTFGFAEYDAPVLEPLELYKTKSGSEIESQLFNFVDKGDRAVALRPEMTPTVCRLVGAKANALKRPIKWFSIAEFYRYERAQKGRLRAFYQFNADIFGEPGPEAEIELIAQLVQCFRAFGLGEQDFYVRLSDRNLWFYFLEALGLDEPRVRAMLSAVDKNDYGPYEQQYGVRSTELKAAIDEFLQVKSITALEQFLKRQLPMLSLGNLSGTMNEQIQRGFAAVAPLALRLMEWKKLLSGLEAMGLGGFVEVDLSVVRGLAYYTGFVFEAFDRKGDLRALAGGGRYDDLVQKLGGPALPAVGFAIGDVTTGLLLEQRGLMPNFIQAPDVYCVIGGEAERRAAFGDIQALRAAGHRVDYPLKDVAFGKQFKAAAESGAKLALIYGADEIAKGVVKVRDLTRRDEQEVPRERVTALVREFFTAT